jgi:hypothetical protein
MVRLGSFFLFLYLPSIPLSLFFICFSYFSTFYSCSPPFLIPFLLAFMLLQLLFLCVFYNSSLHSCSFPPSQGSARHCPVNLLLCAPKLLCVVSSQELILTLCEISSSHGGEYEVQNCLLGCTAV